MKDPDMTTIAIAGAGLIGRAWAFVFARAGLRVQVWDKDQGVLDRFMADLGTMIAATAPFGQAGQDPDGIPGRITICPDLADALAGVDLVQESGPEILEIKRALFADLDRLAAPGTILASSSSALMISTFAGDLAGAGRCLIAHPVNPPHLVPVVELAPGPATATETMTRAEAIYRAAGQVPVVMSQEIDGFILNRLQAVVLAESLRLIEAGVCTVQGLDDTIRHGLGRRWAFMGPMQTISLNAPGGAADYLRRYGATHARLANDAARGEAFTDRAAELVGQTWPETDPDRIRALSQWRDGELAALAQHLAARTAAATQTETN